MARLNRTALGLLALAVAAGATLFVQRREAEALRVELTLLQETQRELLARRAEHSRLLAAQPPAAEVERLRADRAALVRLRAEIDALQADAERKARREAEATTSPGRPR